MNNLIKALSLSFQNITSVTHDKLILTSCGDADRIDIVVEYNEEKNAYMIQYQFFDSDKQPVLNAEFWKSLDITRIDQEEVTYLVRTFRADNMTVEHLYQNLRRSYRIVRASSHAHLPEFETIFGVAEK